MLNQIVLMGRLVKDPDLRMTQSERQVTTFSLAVERDYAPTGEKKEVDFIDCVAWGNTADFIKKYFEKGTMAVVQGRLQFRSWLDKDQKTHNRAEVNVERVYFGESKKKETEEPKLTEITEADGDLPF